MPSTRVDSSGYLIIKAGPQRDQRVHRLVAEAMMGRKLRSDEHVHHVDGNKLNNDWRNLKVLSDVEHCAVTAAHERWKLRQMENQMEDASFDVERM